MSGAKNIIQADNMDVLLVQPAILFPMVDSTESQKAIPPMSLLFLAEPLHKIGFTVHILDRAVTPIDRPAFEGFIKEKGPAVVGITSFTETYYRALEAAAYVKRVDPGIKVVLGGAHVTFTAVETLQNPNVDVVVRGNGDLNFPQLVEHFVKGRYSLAEIPGISFRRAGSIVENPIEIIEDIDALSFPRRDLLDLSLYPGIASISTSRGCPAKCRFCCAGALSGGKYRMRSVSSIKSEIDYLVTEMGFEYLNFLDDTLTAAPARLKAICCYMIEKKYPVHWFCESRADTLDKELLELMKEAGCDAIQLGLESGSQEIMTAIGKKVSPQRVEEAVYACLDAGLRTMGNFIVGFPEDTPKTIQETINLAKRLSRAGAIVGFGGFTPLPGTYYYEHAAELGLNIRATDWREFKIGVPIADTPHFSCEQLREIIFDTVTEAKFYHWISSIF